MEQASAHSSGMYQPIEDYAVIGDLHTVALVGKNGSIDWCCLPRFDSPSVFGALLDVNKGGFFRIAPPDAPGMGHKQLYLPETNMLITRFLTVDGVGEITDFMPVKHKRRGYLSKRKLLYRAGISRTTRRRWPGGSTRPVYSARGPRRTLSHRKCRGQRSRTAAPLTWPIS
jgi:GH15 family glucan-1,4-alpha-glucosidase